LASACAHGGIYSADPKLVKIDFSSSVNPLGAPKKAIRVIKKGAGELAPVYPDPECTELKKAIARHAGVKTSQLAVGNGAVEIIYWFARLYAKKRVVVPAPTFCEYELAAQKAGAEVTFVPLADFRLGADAVIKSAKGADAIFLCNPNNPTGLLSTAEARQVIESVDHSTKILLDECFIELVDRPDANTLVRMTDRHDNLVVLRSLTKSFGMAGLRVGYSVSSPAIADALSSQKVPWNVNGLAQAAGVAALGDDDSHLQRARALVKKERAFLHDRISKIKSLVPLASDSNYFMIQLKNGSNNNSAKFRDQLLRKTGVLVRDCSTFTGMGSQHVRVAVRTHKENVLLVRALEAMDNGKAR
jgi:threonine-phosphate decarboxylase